MSTDTTGERSTGNEVPSIDLWCILELMGHVRLAGRVTEESHFGVALGRIDIPAADGYITQYFGGSSIYRLTPTTEEIARSVALHNQPAPVRTWELPKPQAIDVDEDQDADDDDEAYEMERERRRDYDL